MHEHHPAHSTFVYCPRCAERLVEKEQDGQLRPVCPACGYVHYVDPKLVVAVLAHRDGKVLLHRRAMEPGRGKWTFPSGFVNSGEIVEDAAVREAHEETNAEIELEELLGVFSTSGEQVVLIAYTGKVLNTDIAVTDRSESTQVGFFDPDSLPEMAFERDADIIARWAATRQTSRR